MPGCSRLRVRVMLVIVMVALDPAVAVVPVVSKSSLLFEISLEQVAVTPLKVQLTEEE